MSLNKLLELDEKYQKETSEEQKTLDTLARQVKVYLSVASKNKSRGWNKYYWDMIHLAEYYKDEYDKFLAMCRKNNIKVKERL